MPEDQEAIAHHVMRQVFDLWINPEIERRKAAGTLPDGFVLYAGQIIFDLDLAAPQVRLNEEVRIAIRRGAAKPIAAEAPVREDDISTVESIELTDLDPNSAHVAILRHKGWWFVTWDARYNAERIAETIEAAQEFLVAAADALGKKNFRPFCENLFAATELTAKGLLLMLPDRNLLESKKHSYIASKYNLQGKLGNTDPHHVRLLNDLNQMRESTRYLRKDFTLSEDKAQDMLSIAEAMLDSLQKNAPTRYPVRGIPRPTQAVGSETPTSSEPAS